MKVPAASKTASRIDPISLVALVAVPASVFYWGITSSWLPAIAIDQTTSVAIGFTVVTALFFMRLRRIIPLLTSSPASLPLQLLVLYLLILLLSIIANMMAAGSVDMSLSLKHFEMTLPSFAPLFILAGAPSFSDARQSFIAARLIVALFTVIPALSFLVPSLAIGEIQGIETGAIRSFGVFGDTAAFYISFFAFSFMRTRSVIPFAISLVALLTTGSITALLVFVASAIYEAVRQTLNGSRRAPFALVGGAVLLLLYATGLLGEIIDQLSSAIGFANPLQRLANTSIETSERYYSSMQGLAYWSDSVWLGHGYNSYFQLAGTEGLMRGANPSNALNQMVQTLVDGGALALLALVVFFGVTLVAVPRRSEPDEFGIRTWMMMMILLNHSAVYILPLYHITVFLFGVLGYSLRAHIADVAAGRRPAQPMPAPYPAPSGAHALRDPAGYRQPEFDRASLH